MNDLKEHRDSLLKKLEYFNQLYSTVITFEDSLWKTKLSDARLPLEKETVIETERLINKAQKRAKPVYDEELIKEFEKELDDFRKTPHSRIRNIRVDDTYSFLEISGYCNLLCDWYAVATTEDKFINRKPFTDKNNL